MESAESLKHLNGILEAKKSLWYLVWLDHFGMWFG
jgi:hypothetical protein